jgi:hypothetical protein
MPASPGMRWAFPYGRPLPVAGVRLPIAHHELGRARGIDLKAIAEIAGTAASEAAVYVEANSRRTPLASCMA